MSGSSSDAEQELQLVTALAAASSKHCMGDSQKTTEEIHYHERVYSLLGLPGAMMMIDEHAFSAIPSACPCVMRSCGAYVVSVKQAPPLPLSCSTLMLLLNERQIDRYISASGR